MEHPTDAVIQGIKRLLFRYYKGSLKRQLAGGILCHDVANSVANDSNNKNLEQNTLFELRGRSGIIRDFWC